MICQNGWAIHDFINLIFYRRPTLARLVYIQIQLEGNEID